MEINGTNKYNDKSIKENFIDIDNTTEITNKIKQLNDDEEDPYFPLNYFKLHKYYLINKPIGYLSTKEKDDSEEKTLYTLANTYGLDVDNLGHVGRLDKDTSGIIILTDDSRLNRILTYPEEEKDEEKRNPYKEKEYILILSHFFLYKYKGNEQDLKKLEEEMAEPFSFSRNSVIKNTSQAKIKILKFWQNEELSKGRPDVGWCLEVQVIINEGKHHQVRRIAQRAKLRVISLTRVKIANILTIESLDLNKGWRNLEYKELKEIYYGMNLKYNQNDIYGRYFK